MDAFGDSFGDVDPAAEFLAREQADLAGLEDDLNTITTSNPPADDGFSIANDTSPQGSFEMINTIDQTTDAFPAALSPQDITPSVELLSLSTDGDNGFASPSVSGNASPKKDATPQPIATVRPPREEPEKIKKWREEQKKRLEEKDVNEEKKKAEWREAAKKELEEWYKHHDELVAKTKALNRQAEKELVSEIDEIEPGTEWERIAKLCDFNPKASKASRDVSRMRSIILQLKQNPLPPKTSA